MTTHGLTPCTEMVKGFWASSRGAPAFPFQKERAENTTRLQLTTTTSNSFKNFSTFEIILTRRDSAFETNTLKRGVCLEFACESSGSHPGCRRGRHRACLAHCGSGCRA